jgi:hypothetical protein
LLTVVVDAAVGFVDALVVAAALADVTLHVGATLIAADAIPAAALAVRRALLVVPVAALLAGAVAALLAGRAVCLVAAPLAHPAAALLAGGAVGGSTAFGLEDAVAVAALQTGVAAIVVMAAATGVDALAGATLQVGVAALGVVAALAGGDAGLRAALLGRRPDAPALLVLALAGAALRRAIAPLAERPTGGGEVMQTERGECPSQCAAGQAARHCASRSTAGDQETGEIIKLQSVHPTPRSDERRAARLTNEWRPGIDATESM